MERAVEWYLAITVSVVGVSHLVRPRDWAEAYRQLHACGHPGAFVNGWLNLVSGGLVVAGHGSWAWPGAVLTGFGWLLVGKGIVCLVAPPQGAPVDGTGRWFAADRGRCVPVPRVVARRPRRFPFVTRRQIVFASVQSVGGTPTQTLPVRDSR